MPSRTNSNVAPRLELLENLVSWPPRQPSTLRLFGLDMIDDFRKVLIKLLFFPSMNRDVAKVVAI